MINFSIKKDFNQANIPSQPTNNTAKFTPEINNTIKPVNANNIDINFLGLGSPNIYEEVQIYVLVN